MRWGKKGHTTRRKEKEEEEEGGGGGGGGRDCQMNGDRDEVQATWFQTDRDPVLAVDSTRQQHTLVRPGQARRSLTEILIY
jgi:hypothetical protein